MRVSLKEGEAIVLPRKDRSFDPARIPRAVRDAGFTPREIRVTAVGVLALEKEGPKLEIPGVQRRWSLAGGPVAQEPRKWEDLLGQRVRVIGLFDAGADASPPSLTVEAWSPAVPSDP